MLGVHRRSARNGDAVNTAHRCSAADVGRLRLLSWCHRIAFPHAIKLPGRLQVAFSQRPHTGTAQRIVSAIEQCSSCRTQSAPPAAQARVIGEIAGSLPGTLQVSVLGVLTALLQLCISCPRLVSLLEVLAELLRLARFCTVIPIRTNWFHLSRRDHAQAKIHELVATDRVDVY